MRDAARPRWPVLAAAALASGAALATSVVFRVALGPTLLAFGAVVALAVTRQVRRLPPHLRTALAATTRTGVAVGALATGAYDLSRWALVSLAGLRVRPFETFVLFGRAIAGAGLTREDALAVGTAYHLMNGIAFAVGYCLLFAGRPWPYGVAWAFGLEVLMLGVYPGWLDLRGMMLEFTAVSVTGHLAYGATLGLAAQRAFRAGPPLRVTLGRRGR